MKKIAVLFLVLFALAAIPFSVEAASVKIVNNTASEIHGIYISDSSSDDWEENVIDGSYLPPGNELEIQIPNYTKFDLRVEDNEDNYEDYRGFPGNATTIVLNGEGDADFQ